MRPPREETGLGELVRAQERGPTAVNTALGPALNRSHGPGPAVSRNAERLARSPAAGAKGALARRAFSDVHAAHTRLSAVASGPLASAGQRPALVPGRPLGTQRILGTNPSDAQPRSGRRQTLYSTLAVWEAT